MTDIEPLNCKPRAWILRLNGDGATFDAVCTIFEVASDRVVALGALSNAAKKNGMMQMIVDCKDYFVSEGFLHLEFTHNHKQFEFNLKTGKRRRL